MCKSKHIAASILAGALSIVPCYAGSGGGLAGATEFTQILNNAELLKVGIDGAQTAMTTVNQYMIQIEQYRNQLINMAGIDPARLNAQLNNLNTSYQQLANYRSQLARTNGSLNSQLDSWTQRFTTAKVAGRSLKEQLEVEARLRESRNSAALERARRDEQIMQEVNRDIEQLRLAEAEIPRSQGMNESIQNMHRTMNKIAYQNTKMIELLVEGNATNRSNAQDRNIDAERNARAQKEREDYESALRQRQQDFIKRLP